MKNSVIVIVAAVSLGFLGVRPANAQPSHIEYEFSGTGNPMVSPVVYSGSIDAGEPLLVGGTWDITIDDTGWPADTDKAARWAYVDATFFAPNFDPINLSWTALFDENSTASAPQWRAGRVDTGDLVGSTALQITILDFDFDQVIDPDERAFWIFSGTITVVCDGTGIWSGYCGLGSYSGYSQNPDPVNFADDFVYGNAAIDIDFCATAAEAVTWGRVKQFYRE